MKGAWTHMNLTDIAFAGAAEQARILAAGTITSTALTELYLERITYLDAELGAYSVVLAETARTEAADGTRRESLGDEPAQPGVIRRVRSSPMKSACRHWSAWGDLRQEPREMVSK